MLSNLVVIRVKNMHKFDFCFGGGSIARVVPEIALNPPVKPVFSKVMSQLSNNPKPILQTVHEWD